MRLRSSGPICPIPELAVNRAIRRLPRWRWMVPIPGVLATFVSTPLASAASRIAHFCETRYPAAVSPRSVRKTNGPGGTGYSVACISGGSSFWRRAVLPPLVAHPFFVSDSTAVTGVVDVEPGQIHEDPDPDLSLVVCGHQLLLALASLQ